MLWLMRKKDRKWWIEKGLTSAEVSSVQLDEKEALPEVIYLSHFYPWSSITNLKIAKSYGFEDLSCEWKRDGCI